jgi:hypothetical protein
MVAGAAAAPMLITRAATAVPGFRRIITPYQVWRDSTCHPIQTAAQSTL